jgi:hypothetical protein
VLFDYDRHCEENLLFWLEAEDFKNIPGTDFMKIQARKLATKYITEDARCQVRAPSPLLTCYRGPGLIGSPSRAPGQINVDHKMREACLAQLDNPSRNLFQKVRLSALARNASRSADRQAAAGSVKMRFSGL